MSRHFSTYRGFRRNVARAAHVLALWWTAPLYKVIHKVKAWVDEKDVNGVWRRHYKEVEHYTAVHETFRDARLKMA